MRFTLSLPLHLLNVSIVVETFLCCDGMANPSPLGMDVTLHCNSLAWGQLARGWQVPPTDEWPDKQMAPHLQREFLCVMQWPTQVIWEASNQSPTGTDLDSTLGPVSSI